MEEKIKGNLANNTVSYEYCINIKGPKQTLVIAIKLVKAHLKSEGLSHYNCLNYHDCKITLITRCPFTSNF